MSVNVYCGSGNIVRDPEVKRSASGMAVLPFTLGQDVRERNPETGEYEVVGQFIECVIFGSRAEGLAPILRKGMLVTIQGSLRQKFYTDKEGRRRSSLSVIVNEAQLPPRIRRAEAPVDPREFAEGVAERAERERYGNPPLSVQNGPVGAHAEGDGLYESDVQF